MRRTHHWIGFLSALAASALCALPVGAQSPAPTIPPAHKANVRRAKSAFEEGQRAERAGDWGTAFQAYSEAAEYARGNSEWLLRRETARFRLVQQHVDLAEKQALSGRLDRAVDELHAALKLDPGYSIARERLEQLEAAPSPAPQEARAAAEPAGPVEIEPQAGTRNFAYSGDLRGAYELVAKQFGVAALFDTDLASRPVRFRLNDVDFYTAISLLAQQTKTFWRPMDVHTFFVADDTEQKRREYAPTSVRTILLPAATTPEEMTEMLRLVREIGGVNRTELDTRNRTLTIRDTPRNVEMAHAIIQELEQARGELMLEIEILEVRRDAARTLGITPPSKTRLITVSTKDVRDLENAQTASAVLAIIQRILGSSAALGGQAGMESLLPPVVAFGGGKTTLFATVPGAAADFSKTLNLVRSGRRMLLRAQDGKPATFFIGDRFPITLALLAPAFVTPQTPATGTGQGSFPRTDIPTGTSPVAVRAGTVVIGGRSFLAVANRDSNTVSVLLGNSDGTFPTKNDFTTGKGPVAVAIGDFNGDGKPDLVVANQTDNTMTMLFGNGDGTFVAQTPTIPTGTGPVALAVGDFNRDGKMDLAVVNQTDKTVTILLGNGDGTFKTVNPPLQTGTKPTAILAEDFNGDGNPDLALTNQTSNTVSVFLGNGDGTFKARTDFATGNGPSSLAAADFNGDARLDLVVANQADNTVSILVGDGTGAFGAKTDFATGNGPAAVAAGDFNGDRIKDLVTANSSANTISVLLGVGDGTFSNRLDLTAGSGPVALAPGNFKSDGRLDLAVANQTAGTVSVFLNTFGVAAGAAGQLTPYPGSTYEDIGLKVKATPHLHAEDEVTLQMEFEIRSLSGTSINGIPVISNRKLDEALRLRENETAVLAGIVQKDETRSITGLPGLAPVPAGHLAGRRNAERRDTELVIVLTPRLLRRPLRRDKSIYAGRGGGVPAAGVRGRAVQ